jgi:hypothetical protein
MTSLQPLVLDKSPTNVGLFATGKYGLPSVYPGSTEFTEQNFLPIVDARGVVKNNGEVGRLIFRHRIR